MPENTAQESKRRPSQAFGIAIIVFVVLSALLIARIGPFGATRGGGSADTPPMFTQGVSVQAALDETSDDDRFVVVVASATWCGPCQTYKRTALRDERVESWVRENGLALYIDVDRDTVDAATVGARALPTTVVYHRGKAVARTVGAMNGDNLVRWLDQQRQLALAN
ncbi:MAG: thioredoxin [Phycisphaerales bacterium]|nr:MAG: thioredoxin [Phycisphaerales bacterium]